MSSESVTVTLPEAQTALCGFSHCKRPLPPPGPRGGRPYEFCPDRRWPGDKTCKQLAAAQQALREALGETDPPTALREATDTFADASRRVLEPLQTLGSALDTVTARMQDELTAAAARADEADRAADEAARARREADERADRAEQERAEAVSDAQQARTEAEEAVARAASAVDTADAAELARARAEATAEAAIDRARRAEDENKVVRRHADELLQRLDELRAQLAERTGERDSAVAALDEHRRRSRDLEESLTARAESAAEHLEQVRADLARASEREQELSRRLEQATAEQQAAERAAASAQSEAQSELAALRSQLERLQAQHAAAEQARDTAEQARDAAGRVLHRVHAAVLAAGDDPAALRESVVRELLTRDDPPADAPEQG